ncbi:MAG: DNA polymerase III subunit gamma/tau, partial [Pseudomonas sp.]
WEPAPVAEPVVTAPAAVEPAPAPVVQAPAVVAVAPPQDEALGDDEEPPLGDYDYVEVDNGALDYDFDLPSETAAAAAEPQPMPAAKPATGLAAEWLSLFPQLGLGGMT